MDEIYEYKKITNKHMTVYRIHMNNGNSKGGWYRQITSMEAFVENIGTRWYNNFYLKSIDTRVISRCDHLDKEGWLRINNYIEGCDKYTISYKAFDSVWDFYGYINYNHKNKSKKQLDNLIVNWRD